MNKTNNSWLKEVFLLYHNKEIYNKIIPAFESSKKLKDSPLMLGYVSKILGLGSPFTIGITGKLGLEEYATSSEFPNVMLTNELTNPETFTFLSGNQTSLNIVGFSDDSYAFQELDNISAIDALRDQNGPYIGPVLSVTINHKEEGVDHDFNLSGEIDRGFVLFHEEMKIHSLDEVFI